MTPHAVFIFHRTSPGQRDAAALVWNRILKPAILSNPDHLAYVYTLPDDEPDVIRAFQLYRSPEAAAEFLQTPEYLEYVAAVDLYLDGPPQVASSRTTWVKS